MWLDPVRLSKCSATCWWMGGEALRFRSDDAGDAATGGLASFGIGTMGDLRADLLNTYWLSTLGPDGEVQRQTDGSWRVGDFLELLEAVCDSACHKHAAIAPAAAGDDIGAKVLAKFRALAKLANEIGDFTLFPILTAAEVTDLGLAILDQHWAAGNGVEFSDGREVSFRRLGEAFLERLHVDCSNCSVLSIESSEGLELFPDRSADVLLVGYEKDESRKWLVGLASGLFPGEETISVRIITDQKLLEHISLLPEYYSQTREGSVFGIERLLEASDPSA